MAYNFSNFIADDYKQLQRIQDKIDNLIPPSETRRFFENKNAGTGFSVFGGVEDKLNAFNQKQMEKTFGTVNKLFGGALGFLVDTMKNNLKLFYVKFADGLEHKMQIRYDKRLEDLKQQWMEVAGDEFPFLKDVNGTKFHFFKLKKIWEQGLSLVEKSETATNLAPVEKRTVIKTCYISLDDKIKAAEAFVSPPGEVKEKNNTHER